MSRHLYSITLQKPSTIHKSVLGRFMGGKNQELVVCRGSHLELMTLDKDTGRLELILSQNCFGIIREIVPFRVSRNSKERLLVTSDSGNLSVLEYRSDRNRFVKLFAEPFGKTGVRRVVPGEYLAVDPLGRACMVASVEKNKLVYGINRDRDENVVIASPLEAHSKNTLVYDLVALDTGNWNPMFATLEVNYKGMDEQVEGEEVKEAEKVVVFNELDLGINHVIAPWRTVVDRDSNILIQVLGGENGPGGVLVGTKDWIYYVMIDHPAVRVPIPRRIGSEESLTIINGVMHRYKGQLFFFLQASNGDLFMLTMDIDRDEERGGIPEVKSMTIKFLQTIPVCNSLNIFRLGLLFCATESGNHIMYQIDDLGDETDFGEYSSRDYRVENEDVKVPTFKWQPTESLRELSSLNSLAPLMGIDVVTNGDSQQIITMSGRGNRSTLRSLKYGLPSTPITTSTLPARPLALWSVKLRDDDKFDKYIVLSFANSTMVLEVGEKVSQVKTSGIAENVRTLAIQQLGRDTLIQVHPNGIRHLTAGKEEVVEWKPNANERIVHASANNYQVAIGLNTNQIVYFEIDEEGNLNEYNERVDVPGGIACLCVGDIPSGRVRTSFMAVGCQDATIRILSLDLGSTLEVLTIQALTAEPSSIVISHMQHSSESVPFQLLHIGLANGVYISSVLDNISGQLSDTRTRFLGPRAVGLFAIKVGSERVSHDAVLALSSKPWLGYTTATSSFDMAPVDVPSLRYASTLSSSVVPNGIIGVEENNLHIFTITDLQDKLRQTEIPLKYTPRRMVRPQRHPSYCYVVESDNNLSGVGAHYERKHGHWSSCIEVVDPAVGVLDRVILTDNEAAFSIGTCIFSSDQQEYLVVGTAKDQVMLPKSCESGFIRVYKFSGERLELVHVTPVSEAPLAFLCFNGLLFAGIGNKLRVYDMGKKQLLRKQELELPISCISTLSTAEDMIIVGDMRDSVTYVVHKETDNALIPFADDTVSRHVTSSVQLDPSSTLCGDRFGNVFLLACPQSAMDIAHEDDHGVVLRNEQPTLNGSSAHRLELVSHFFTGDLITSVCRASLVPGGAESVLYAGIQGTIGALVPIASKSDAIFFESLETLIRKEHDELVLGRDHLIYRGYYAPVKATIDGDLCERFASLPSEVQQRIASELNDRTPRDVEKKIADMRIRSVF